MKNATRLAFVFLSIISLNAQPSKKPALTPRQIPRDVMYRIVFKEIVAYQAQADQLAIQNKPDAAVRNYHRDLFQLSPQNFTKVKDIALNCVQQIRVIDEQAKQIIDAIKSKYKDVPRDSPNRMVPPLPPELLILEERRTSLVFAAADSLSVAIGPGQFAYFENIARRHVGSGFTAKAITDKTEEKP